MRKTVWMQVAVMALGAAAPMMAQGGGMGGMRMGDPTKQVAGTGELPAGWMVRFDPVRPGQPEHTVKEIAMTPVAGGYHFTSGPAAIYYATKEMGKGEFSISATFAQPKSMMHEAYGLFIGGADLQDSSQSYTYFVIKPFDGTFLIKRRESNARPSSPPPVVSAAIVKDDPTDGHATNTLMIHVAKDSVHFIINGKLVKGMSKAELGGSTDGQVGVRINHNLDVTMTGYTLKKN